MSPASPAKTVADALCLLEILEARIKEVLSLATTGRPARRVPRRESGPQPATGAKNFRAIHVLACISFYGFCRAPRPDSASTRVP